MSNPLFSLLDIHLTFGGTPLFNGCTCHLASGERTCLVGRNGSGKSTLLKIAAGQILPDRGTRFLQPGTQLSLLEQEPDLSKFDTTLEYALSETNKHTPPHLAQALLDELGLTGRESPRNLSEGERRRAAIAKALAKRPDLLLMDEPTNYLDVAMIEWLEQYLLTTKMTAIIVSHDRRFLQSLTQSVFWLDRGFVRKLNAGFAQFEKWQDDTLEQERVATHKLDRQIAQEEDWVRYGVTARRKRNVRRMAELANLKQKKDERINPLTISSLKAVTDNPSSKIVIDVKQINKSWNNKVVVKNLSLRVQRGDRLALIGPNGAGKTTLLNLLTGQIAPDSGQVTLGTSVNITQLDYQRKNLDPDKTLVETLATSGDIVNMGDKKRHVIGYMKDFMFRPEQALTPIKSLSGGEYKRLLLARSLAQSSNVFILDEPTNDLDVETLDLLQEMLCLYEGTVIFVSHDRDFVDRVATSVLVADKYYGDWQIYTGGYSDMIAVRGQKSFFTSPPSNQHQQNHGNLPRAIPQRHKLSYKEQFILRQLEANIPLLEEKVQNLRNKLADPLLYTHNKQEFLNLSDSLNKYETELTDAEERWLELEIRQESLDKR